MSLSLRLPKNSTILHEFLKHLRIRFTNRYLYKSIQENPNSNNLYGISDILYQYKIENLSIRVAKEDFYSLDVPFIAQLDDKSIGFVIVTKIEGNSITYLKASGSKSTDPSETFFSKFTGIVLLAEASELSIEDNFVVNRKREFADKLRLPFILAIVLISLIWLLLSTWGSFKNIPPSYLLQTILYSLGSIAALLLVIQTIDKNNPFVKSVCSLAKSNGNCSDVLESSASKLLGIVSWSEIGLIYFGGNLLTLLFFPSTTSLLFLLNIMTLPYTIWSIYYQWKVAKQWCVLCLSVQALLWCIFVTYLLGGTHLSFSALVPVVLAKTIFLFLLVSAFLWFILPFTSKAALVTPIIKELNDLKSNETIFEAVIKAGQPVKVEGLNQIISLGNPNAQFRITMVTSPFCTPCAEMHEKFQKLMVQFREDICIEFIYAATNNIVERNNAIRYLIDIYLSYDKEKAEEIYAQWYSEGKTQVEAFMRRYPTSGDKDQILKICESHKKWCLMSEIKSTPAIFVNYHRLPEWYDIENLKYFIRQ